MSFHSGPHSHNEMPSSQTSVGASLPSLDATPSKVHIPEGLTQHEKENLVWLEQMIKSHELAIADTQKKLKSAQVLERGQLKKRIQELTTECDIFKKGKEKLTKKALVHKMNALEEDLETEWEQSPALSTEKRIEAQRAKYDIDRRTRNSS